MKFDEKIWELAGELVDSTDADLNFAAKELDESEDYCEEAGNFLKYNGKRLGRDFELYNFMSKVAGVPFVVTALLEELVLPLKAILPESFAAGIRYLRNMSECFPEDKRQEWGALLDQLEG